MNTKLETAYGKQTHLKITLSKVCLPSIYKLQAGPEKEIRTAFKKTVLRKHAKNWAYTLLCIFFIV